MKNNKTINFLTKVGIFSALSYILYLVKFPLPFFPSFLEIQFSNIPLILGGFVLGPGGGIIIAVIKFLLKLLSTHTAGVGEATDLVVSLCVVISSSLIYQRIKTKKGGILALIVASICWIISACFVNAFISIPFYAKAFGLENVIAMVNGVLKNIELTKDNFMKYYLLLSVIPFNLLLSLIVSIVTFLVYKRISVLFKKDFFEHMNNKKKALIMCDSFKGTMTSREVNHIIGDELNKIGYQTECISISDGGEGFLETIEEINPNLKRINVETFDAIGRSLTASFLFSNKTKTAFFCLADSVGITHLTKEELSPLEANTYGLGVMINHAITKYHAKNIVLGIGGSASTDAGAGIIEAMGVKFYNKNNELITNIGNGKLKEVETIDLTTFNELIKGVNFKTLTDVTNPLCGENGAAFIYAPQKGARVDMLEEMDQNVRTFAEKLEKSLGKSYIDYPGAGAAGGVGYIMKACFNSTLQVGIDYVLKELGFETKSQEYDLIITGEGSFDEQSLNGKVISGIMKYNPKNLNIVSGLAKIELDDYPVYSVVPTVATTEESLANPKECLKKLIIEIYSK